MLALARTTPSKSDNCASTRAVLSVASTTRAMALIVPTRAGDRNRVSSLVVTAVMSAGRAGKTALAAAESSMAAKKPPCTVPCRFVKASTASKDKVAVRSASLKDSTMRPSRRAAGGLESSRIAMSISHSCSTALKPNKSLNLILCIGPGPGFKFTFYDTRPTAKLGELRRQTSLTKTRGVAFP